MVIWRGPDALPPSAFSGRLTDRRWGILPILQGLGEVPVRELAQRLERDGTRVHQDVGVLVTLGLIERTERGGLLCSFDDIHVDRYLRGTT